MKVRTRALFFGSVLLAAGGATAQETSMQAGKAPAADAAFMKSAAADGMAEVELGRLASEKATRQEVKDFGKMMVDDHTKANDELKGLASRKGVTLPTDLKPQHKAEKDRLSKLSGAAFDDAYVKAMVADHQKAVDAFSKESAGGKDPETKAWAGQTLPKLQEHLSHVKQLAGRKDAASTPAHK
jgi:putative membrane protein